MPGRVCQSVSSAPARTGAQRSARPEGISARVSVYSQNATQSYADQSWGGSKSRPIIGQPLGYFSPSRGVQLT